MADKLLMSRRLELVENLSEDGVMHLLNDLEGKTCLNPRDKEDVIKNCLNKSDRAGRLIDMMIKRGPKTSEMLLSSLKEWESTRLVSPSEPPATPPELPWQEGGAAPARLIHCSEKDYRDLLKTHGSRIYPLKDKNQRSRLALLINNVKFDKHPERRGASKDEQDMKNLLIDLGYSVVICRNRSAQDMENDVREFSQRQEHSESDSAFVVIMSHGERHAISGIHDDEYGKRDLFPIDKIFIHLNNENCRLLRHKPKVILIQACRGGESGSFWSWESDSASRPPNLEADSTREQHRESDFICFKSCTPGAEAYRNGEVGAIFIQRLVRVIKELACKQHIEELFAEVRSEFEKIKWQLPSVDRLSLLKKFYLFPGL